MTAELTAEQRHVDAARVLEIEQALLRIPSSAFEEQAIADHLAERMNDIGLDVTMMEVPHPFDPTKRSRQPVGLWRGSGGGPRPRPQRPKGPPAPRSGPGRVPPCAPKEQTTARPASRPHSARTQL